MAHASAVTGVADATVVHADGTVALDATTLLAHAGEVLAVLGPSGSGKSTLLRAIAGLTDLRSGRVLIDGHTVTGSTGQRNVSMVFEDTQLIPFLDVARNLSFGLDLSGTPKEESRSRVAQQARGLRISRLLHHRPETLSPGERGRVGIGRALVRAPKAFLLDEPLAHLDAAERSRVRVHIREAVKAAGVTTIYVTHDQTEAMAVGDRLAVLRAGRVAQLGTPREVYAEPVDAFVAGFVSSTPVGLVPAQVVVSGGMSGYRVADRLLPTYLPLPGSLAGYSGTRVLLGIRAEDVHEVPEPQHGTMTATVATLERLGPCTLVGLDVGGHRLAARFDRRTDVRLGQVVTVGVDAARAHVFDATTERALAHPPPDV